MARDTEIETISRSSGTGTDGRGAVALASNQVTDSRLVSDHDGRTAGSYNPGRSDIGAKGMQFILTSWATLYSGLWLVIAPFALTYASYAPRAHANDMIVGALIATMGATRVFGNYRSGNLNRLISALTILPGVWLILAPFIANYTDWVRPTRVDIITGIAVILFSLWSMTTSRDDETTGHTAR